MTANSTIPLAIVVPTLNAGAYLATCLTALAPAVRMGASVTVVDGGSTDGTIDIAQSHGIRVAAAAGSMYAALNAGFRGTSEPWLTWINADDVLFCDLLPLRLAAAAKADIAYGRVDFLDPLGRFVHSWLSASPGALSPLYRNGYSPLLQQGTLFRRSVFEHLGGFDDRYRYVGDADFWWRAVEAGFIFARSRHPPVAAFRMHHGQLSAKNEIAMKHEHADMVARHGGRWRPASLAPLALWRLENLGAYGMRLLRRVQLDGTMRLAPSYDIPVYERQ